MVLVNFLFAIYSLILILVCIRIITHTTTPSKGLAYLLLVIVIPILGIIFYLSVGLNYRKDKLYQKKIAIDNKTFPQLKEKSQSYTKNLLKRHETFLGVYFPLASFLNKNSLISDNNSVRLLINGEEKFPEIIKSLKAARHHIHIEYYIYENDLIGNKLSQILISKAREGIKVRFIYDDFGSRSIRSNFIKELRKNGIEAFAFNEVNFIQFANRLNYRNHRKIIVVDGKIGFIGGINVSDKYINPSKTNIYWRDTHLKVEGNAVFNLQYTFLTDWNFCAEQNIEFSKDLFPIEDMRNGTGNSIVQIIASGPDSDYPSIMYSLIQTILSAKKEILISTPYLIPNTSFLNALKIAALSNVKIKIIVPYKSDSLVVGKAVTSFFRELLEAGVSIYRYKKGFIHSKTMVCDGLISHIGTANLDNRSFDLNFEINAVIYDHKIADEMKVCFNKDLEDSENVLLSVWNKRPFHIKLTDRILYLFAPLM